RRPLEVFPDAATLDNLRTRSTFRIVIRMLRNRVVLSLEGRVAVVTGGSRGIGAAIVRLFSQAGARVLFNYRKAKAEAEHLVRECEACGGEQEQRCAAVQAELASSAAANLLVEAAVQRFGKVDIVVGNHGIWPSQDAPVDQMSDEQWRSTMA